MISRPAAAKLPCMLRQLPPPAFSAGGFLPGPFFTP